MAEDILEQAAQRRLRRAQKNVSRLEEFENIPSQAEDKKNGGAARSNGTRTTEKSLNDFSLFSVDEQVARPLFIHCMCYGHDVKALLNTSSAKSSISRQLADRVFPETSDRLDVKLIFNTRILVTSMYVADDIPDVVLGNDFMIKQKCVINYEDRNIRIGGSKGTTVDFLNESAIPLHFRCKDLSVSV